MKMMVLGVNGNQIKIWLVDFGNRIGIGLIGTCGLILSFFMYGGLLSSGEGQVTNLRLWSANTTGTGFRPVTI